MVLQEIAHRGERQAVAETPDLHDRGEWAARRRGQQRHADHAFGTGARGKERVLAALALRDDFFARPQFDSLCRHEEQPAGGSG